MTVEKALTADVGAPGARLHTGRSRNDQVATDTRLHAKALLDMLMRQNCALRRTILRAARKNVGVVMPGYTHMQHAQPVLFSHHLLAYFWMFTRDFKRLRDAFAAADANPPWARRRWRAPPSTSTAPARPSFWASTMRSPTRWTRYPTVTTCSISTMRALCR